MFQRKYIYNKNSLIKSCITIFNYKESLLIKGPLGVLILRLPSNVFFKKTDFGFQVFGINACQNLVLTCYKLLCQKIRGVELGFFEILIIQGIG